MRTADKKKKVEGQKCKAKMQKMGAWTVAILPVDVRKIFGTGGYIRIKGTIDGVPFNDTSLMPMGTGEHLIAVRAEVRKAIGKGAGDTIEVIFERDFSEIPVPEELQEAFEASEEAKRMFDSYAPSHRRNYIRYINEGKTTETRAKRAVKTVLDLEKAFFEKGIKEKNKK